MKKASLFLLVSTCLVLQGNAQSQLAVLDSLESSFERVVRDTKIPCQYGMDFKRKANGRPYFLNNDSTRLEFDYFKASSLPFYTSEQKNIETTLGYYDWISQQIDNINNILLQKEPEDSVSDYMIYKITTDSGSFYRLFARNGDIAFSIKIFDPIESREDQLDKLRTLWAINKK